MNFSRVCTLNGATYALLAVAMGAFGAHALEASLEELGSLRTWDTAVDYQIWHALALLIIASLKLSPRPERTAAICMSTGILLFSGSLYWLALDGPKWLGPITPLGGLCLIIGWGLLAYSSIKHRSQ